VVEALKLEFVGGSTRPLIDIGTRNVEAYNAYLRGTHLAAQGTRRSHHQAKAQFESALALDPEFEEANVAAAFNLFLGRQFTPEWRDEAAQRIERAERAGLLERPAETLVREMYPEQCPPPIDLAREAIDKLREGDPAWTTFAYWQVGDVLTMVGALRGALAFFRHHRVLTEESVGDNVRMDQWESFILAALGEFQGAIDLWTRRIEITPDVPLWIGDRLLLYIRTGQHEKSVAELEKVNAVWPRNFAQFYDLYWRREIDAAKAYWAWLGERASLMPVLKFWGFALVGDIERSLDHLEEQFQTTAPLLVHVQARRVLPASVMREIGRHPRYRALLTRLGIDDEARAQVLALVNGASDLTGIRVAPDEPV
jgi:tetratricopeptide (TPR) repeat protein